MKENQKLDPPEFLFKLLRFICNPSTFESIEGDLYEVFEDRTKKYSIRKARWLLYRDALSMLRPFALKRSKNHYSINQIDMFFNYFKLTYRNIKRDALNSFINIFGLSMAIACCIVLFLLCNNILTANNFIKDSERIYMVTSHAKDLNKDPFIWGKSPELLGPSIKEDFDGVESQTRYQSSSVVMRYNDIIIEENIEFVDHTFLKIFNFDLKQGLPNTLSEPNSIVLSNDVAIKFFGNSNPVGQEVNLIISGKNVPMVVGAVAESFPNNSYFDFNILAPYSLIESHERDWSKLVNATFIKLASTSSLDILKNHQEDYSKAYNARNTKYSIEYFDFIAFDQLTKTNQRISRSVVGKEHPTTVIIGIFLGFTLLFISCINYINIALVSASKRLKEIGMRKSVGASRKQLILQFLSQNIFLCFSAVALGVIIAHVLIIPVFNSFFPFEFAINYLNGWIWLFLFTIAIVTGLVSGLYPAFYISAFSVTNILRGKERFSSNKNLMFRFFLGIQFAFTFLLIFSGISFIKNSQFQRNIAWGYNQSGLITIPLNEASQYASLQDKLMRYSDIKMLSAGKNHIGGKASFLNLKIGEDTESVLTYDVGEAYLNTLELNIIEGRNFNNELASDKSNGIIINESFAKTFLVESGSYIKSDSNEYQIVGIVEDFHYRNFYAPIKPVVFRISEHDDFQYIIAKVNNEEMTAVNNKIKTDWLNLFPDYPYNGYYQNEIFDNFYREMSIPTNALITFAIISIILSSMGLFGLVSLMITKRLKEIGIRKVLGASLISLSLIIQKQFIIILIVSFIVAVPFSQQLIKNYLDEVNAFHAPIGLGVVFISVMVLTLIVLLTISSNILKLARTNPTETLRDT